MARVLEKPEVSASGDRVSSGPFALVFVQGGPLLYVDDEVYETDLKCDICGDIAMLTSTWSDPPVSVMFPLTLEQYERITDYK